MKFKPLSLNKTLKNLNIRTLILFSFILIFQAYISNGQNLSQNIRPSDYYKISRITQLDVTKDGNWLAYNITRIDTAKNKRISHIWLQSSDGKESIQLTNGLESELKPKFSPDGKMISFFSSRESEMGAQIWIINRQGGEAKKITQIKGDIEDLDWSPDGKKWLLSIQDPEPKPKENSKTPDPIVLDRYHFKQDVEGYLGHRHTHLYIFDLESQKLDTLTYGNYDENQAQWSPDGTEIVFVSNHTPDPDKNSNTDIFTMEPKKGGWVKQITTWPGENTSPKWSPKGNQLIYLQSTGKDNFIMYDQDKVLFLVNKDGTGAKPLTAGLDRSISNPCWSSDEKTIGFLVEDDRKSYLAEIEISSGNLHKWNEKENAIMDLHTGPENTWFGLESDPKEPFEVYRFEKGEGKRISFVHSEWLKKINLATVRGFTSRSKDQTLVSGLLYTPSGTKPNEKLPLILFIHGGPVSQDEYAFDFTRQVLAQAGYYVIGVNYRGSSGRGVDYSKSIYGDWGNKEVMDLLGAVDEIIKEGLADPDHLGLGGWSYGGILTNYTIATDTRFKAAASGAGSSLQLSMYGVDQYILQYENEIGQPWKNQEKWIKISYPFFKADKIKTPTLFMAGEKDFNVPSIGAEQMYQALKSLNIPTQLIIYPGQNHEITIPTYIVDRLNRWISWYDQYLKNKKKD